MLTTLDRAYSDAGYAGGWAEHYQGGPVGYRQREFEIVPGQTDSRWYSVPVEEGHAVAWNRSPRALARLLAFWNCLELLPAREQPLHVGARGVQ